MYLLHLDHRCGIKMVQDKLSVDTKATMKACQDKIRTIARHAKDLVNTIAISVSDREHIASVIVTAWFSALVNRSTIPCDQSACLYSNLLGVRNSSS